MGRFTILVINKKGKNVMKHGGVEYYSLVTTCWHAPPSFNIFGQHPDINIDRLLLLVTGEVLTCMDQLVCFQ
jgi:hypothetical protein